MFIRHEVRTINTKRNQHVGHAPKLTGIRIFGSNSKNCAFDEEINNLYEEMEEQINAEKQRIRLEVSDPYRRILHEFQTWHTVH
jgi:hypothetical protein